MSKHREIALYDSQGLVIGVSYRTYILCADKISRLAFSRDVYFSPVGAEKHTAYSKEGDPVRTVYIMNGMGISEEYFKALEAKK